MSPTSHRIIRIVLTLIVVSLAAYVACNRTIFVMAVIFPMFTLTLGSMILILFSVRPRLDDAVFVVALTLLHAVVAYMLLYNWYHSFLWILFAGLSSFWVLCIRTIWAPAAERKVLQYATFCAVLLLTVESSVASTLKWAERMHPKVLDLFLHSFDGSLGTQISFQMGMAFARWHLLRSTAVFFYEGLPVAIALVCAQQIAARKGKALSTVTALVATGPIGVATYNLFPALGPRLISLWQFPFHPLTRVQTMNLPLVEISAIGPRNAIPSLHMAWVLLIWWYSRGLSWPVRAVAFLFLIFTIAATIGTGEHYFVDLVVGFPFAVFMESLCSFSTPWRSRPKMIAFVWGVGATLTWLALLRFAPSLFWISPIIPWGMVVATIALSIICERSLHAPVTKTENVAAIGFVRQETDA
jgi:PAP2 superfamily